MIPGDTSREWGSGGVGHEWEAANKECSIKLVTMVDKWSSILLIPEVGSWATYLQTSPVTDCGLLGGGEDLFPGHLRSVMYS